ncbi:GIY-YIG nuclease family protein [Bacillus seohaeanensis]|uniref:GIY-YIG nuclease family protein n=1 Tax=Bacillus seohaeanensis TaxID=284580 RepID=A0ABW5RM75_9BACI
MVNDIRSELQDFLESKQYIPLTSPLWNYFYFSQKKPQSSEEESKQLDKIKSQLKKERGIYALELIKENKSELLYIGKGNPIRDRILSHYKKLSKNPKKDKDNRIKFFQENQGEVKIYYLELNEKGEQEIIEHLLSYILQPKYKKWRPI